MATAATATEKRAQVTMTEAEWLAEGERRFGPNKYKWRFVCPSCANEITVAEWIDAGAPERAIAYSCVGRWLPTATATIFEKDKGFCNYAGGGLFGLNPITIKRADGGDHHVFDFAPVTPDKECA